MKICTGLISICLYNYKLHAVSYLFFQSLFRSEMEYVPLKINVFRYEYIPLNRNVGLDFGCNLFGNFFLKYVSY